MTSNTNQRITDLLIQRVTYGLNEPEQSELERLLDGQRVSESEFKQESEQIELTVAAADLAWFENEQRLPDRLHENILIDAGKYFEAQAIRSPLEFDEAGKISSAASRPDHGLNFWRLAAVLSTAACLLLLLFPWRQTDTPTVAELQEQFLASQPVDMIDIALSPGFDSSGSDLKGRLVWSDKQQKGFMTLTNLKINDPTKEQYQLWIFDRPDQLLPVDGGVFDVDSAEQIVEIDPNIFVKARHWAITVEKPGGVMQSDRSRIAAIDPELLQIVSTANN